MFDKLTERVEAWSQTLPDTPPEEWALSSNRVLSGSDRDEHVVVTVRDFKVASIRIDDGWYAASMPELSEIEQAVAEAVNVTLERYWAEELAAAQEAYTPMGEVAAGLRELSGEFRGAYEKAVERLERHT
ncbi:MAG: hypothetical protein Q4G45_00170 [Actinomycetia bacterium]|nr:hypothetical protein [Actinomycetes bacterium]